MPDHVHLLVEIPQDVSLTSFVRHFKQTSAFHLRPAMSSSLLQISYFDRILRTEESILDVARYIWDNPVKEGLAKSWTDYSLSGPRELLISELGAHSKQT